MNKIENKDICSQCGGMCCKKSGCDYWVNDLKDKSLKGILEFLSSGKVSIVALMNFQTIGGKIVNTPFLYTRKVLLNLK